VIQAKKHLGLGYPRNDLLLKKHEPLDIALCDLSLYELVKTRFEKGEKSVIYMPTHRESKHSATPPLDLKKLYDFLETLDIVMVFKLHAFALANINSKQELKNIYFHNASGDVYPLLKYTDILITDYSSVYFDFLFLNRAIVFFDYDYEEYSANMGGFLYDYEEFSPGLHVKTQEQLQKALSRALKQDEFKEKREALWQRLFDNSQKFSCEKIQNFMSRELVPIFKQHAKIIL
jgi:CDP-glycerol glycerophosphotransferase (TagB/SpsB family)